MHEIMVAWYIDFVFGISWANLNYWWAHGTFKFLLQLLPVPPQLFPETFIPFLTEIKGWWSHRRSWEWLDIGGGVEVLQRCLKFVRAAERNSTV